MTISFIIPAYHEEKYIGKCLESIIKQGPADAEIIVVDNNSTDLTAELVKQFPGVILLKEEKKGTNSARQRGLSTATGELVAFIDADCLLPADWLRQVQTEFTKTEIAGLSGVYKFYDLNSLGKKLVIAIWNYFAWLTSLLVGYAIYGGNFIAKKKLLQQAGGFDTSITFYGDDTAMGKKLRQFGKVKFSRKFFVYSSYRRLKKEGMIISGFKYLLNYFWIAIFKKPFHRVYDNIR